MLNDVRLVQFTSLSFARDHHRTSCKSSAPNHRIITVITLDRQKGPCVDRFPMLEDTIEQIKTRNCANVMVGNAMQVRENDA